MEKRWKLLALVAVIIVVIASVAYYGWTYYSAPSEKTKVVITTTTMGPETYNATFQKFMQLNPDIEVEWRTVPSNDYRTQVVAQLLANPGEVDIIDIMYGEIAFYADQFVIPLNDIEGIQQINNSIMDSVRGMCTYNGKLYGVPFFNAVTLYVYNKAVLAQYGYNNPPTTKDELIQMGLDMKAKGLAYPIIVPWSTAYRPMTWFWYMTCMTFDPNYKIFDANWNPTFLDSNSVGWKAAKFMYDLMNTYQIVDPASLETDMGKARDMFAAGKYAFSWPIDHHSLINLNNPASYPATAGNFSIFPALDTGYTSIRSDQFGITQGSKAKGGKTFDAAVKLLKWMATPTEFPKAFAINRGVVWGYTALSQDQEVLDRWKTWLNWTSNQQQMAKLIPFEKMQPSYLTSWNPDLTIYSDHALWNLLHKDATLQQTMQGIADKAVELRAG